MKHEKTPGLTIQTEFDKWAAKTTDEETEKAAAKFLARLSDEYESAKKQVKSAYLIDEAQTLFRLNQVRIVKEALDEDLEQGDADKAFARIEKLNPIQIDSQVGIDVLRDTKAIFEATDNPAQDILIDYGKEAIGRFMGDTMSRGHLVAYYAPEKTGKTFHLLDTAVRGMEQERTVAFFAVGDMNQKQMMRRFLTRFAGKPFKPQEYKVPIALNAGDPPEPEIERKTAEKYLSMNLAMRRIAAYTKGADKKPLLRLFTYPNSSINVNGIKSVLHSEKRRGWVADIVVIDYADILAPMNGTAETRDQIDATWRALRSLAHDKLVVTASQTNKESYETEVITKGNFSGNKLKNAHANVIIGINVTDDEKDKGMCRLNFPAARENEFTETKCVYCAGSLALARPIMFSSF